MGYAFINFLEMSQIRSFYSEFNGKKWSKFNSEKVSLCNFKKKDMHTEICTNTGQIAALDSLPELEYHELERQEVQASFSAET